MRRLRLSSALLLLMLCVSVFAQFNKEKYYAAAVGKKGQALKTALAGIIRDHKALSYDQLWTAFRKTDCREDGKVWDMYSATTNFTFGNDQAGSYSKEGDVYNREHSFPKSWFNDAKPMYSDLYHLYPTDGYVNNRRSNFCFGDVDKSTYESNKGWCKLGNPTRELTNDGCRENLVFEPNALYKGDFARSYFYMVTAYESIIKGWNSGMLDGSTYPSFSKWAKNLLLKWSKHDVISKKETDRIEAVYSYQNNRNPFIDFPGLEEYIWGSYTDVPFSVTAYVNPYEGGTVTPDPETPDQPDTPTPDPENPDQPDQPDPTEDPDPSEPDEPIIPDTPQTGDYTYVQVMSAPANWTGEYLIVYVDGASNAKVLDVASSAIGKANNYLEVALDGQTIAASEKVDQAAVNILPSTKDTEAYALQSVLTKQYIGSTSKGLYQDEKDIYPHTFSVSSGFTTLQCGNVQLRYNKSASLFRYYSSGQEPVSLFKKTYKDVETGIVRTEGNTSLTQPIYDIMGRRLQRIPERGVYIIGGRKYVK